IRVRPDIQSAAVGWRGYLRKSNFRDLRAYLVLENGKEVCKVGSVHFDADFEFVGRNEVGKAYAVSDPPLSGTWTRNGYYPDAGKPPIADDAFGSWSGSEKNTGTISIGPFVVLKDTSAIVLPVVTGRNAKKSSIRVINDDTGETLA